MIGILMLDTAFPRPVGDVGNPGSFDHPVRYAIVPGATPDAIVRGDLRPWIDAFIEAGRILVAQGCSALVTTCGFLTPLRRDLERSFGVPVISSALDLIPRLVADGRRPGILTISAQSLTDLHLDAAGVPRDIPIHGVDHGHFATSILENRSTFDMNRAEIEISQAAKALVAAHPQIDAIVLECTNMPPYAQAIAHAAQRPTLSILDGIADLRAGRRIGPRVGCG